MNMKAVALMLAASFFLGSSFAQKNQAENPKSQRITKILNSQWTFNYFPANDQDKGYELSGFDDSRWPAISIPHTWNSYETTRSLLSSKNADGSDNSYWKTGWGWYRKHFSVNREFAGRKYFIEFTDVRNYCKVWLNGKYLGEHNGSYVSFEFDITSKIKPLEDNVLVVAVSGNAKDVVTATAGNADVSGGIFNNVTIVLKDKLYIPMQGSAGEGATIVTTPQVSEKEATVRIQTCVKNDYSQKISCYLLTTITDDAGKIIQSLKSDAEINPGQLFRFDQIYKPIRNPHVWTNKDPYLYRIESSVIKDKIVTDAYSRPLGFRLFKSDIKENALVVDTVKPLSPLNFLTNDNTESVSTTNGEAPVKILLTGHQNKIKADRGSVVIIDADILDAKGNHTSLSNITLKWNISGPATLVGPDIYDQNLPGNMTLSNAIRSTGEPGKIHISVTASGIVSGTCDIEAVEAIADNSVIQEPILNNMGRRGVNREVVISRRLSGVPVEINPIQEEISFDLQDKFDKQGYKKMISDYVSKNNPTVDTTSVEFKSFSAIMAVQLTNSEGRITAEDYNFSAGNYNNCRLISHYINSTKLPQFFKDGLRKYYSDAVIKKGNEKDAGDEMNWLNWIPSGGTVVVVQDDNTVQVPQGVILTKYTDLKDIISVVYPQFANFSTEAQERALLFTGKVNPYVHKTSGITKAGDNMKSISYLAEKGQPILVPLLKFISE